MTFIAPNAVTAMNIAVAEVEEDGDSWEIIGDPLTKVVDETTPKYDEALDLKLDPSPGAKRAEISTMRWGKITKDIARLTGLARALENIAEVIKSGKDTIALDWQGEAFDAFRANIEKVERTLVDYAAAVRTTADGLARTITGAQQIFTTYRDDTRDRLLNFDKFTPPDEWRRMTTADADLLAERCTSHSIVDMDCLYNDPPFAALIDRKLVTKTLFDQLEKWDCTGNPEVIAGQYDFTVKSAYDERTAIQNTIHEWYKATDLVRTLIGDALDEALNNLRLLAELKVFSRLAVPGATTAAPQGSDPGPTGGDPGASHPGPGYPSGDETAMPEPTPEPSQDPEPSPEPEQTPEPEPAPVDPVADPEAVDPEATGPGATDPDTTNPETTDPESTDPEATEPEATEPGASDPGATDPENTGPGAGDPEATGPETSDPEAGEVPAGTVQIKDGDRTISVSNPADEGLVKLTVTDGSGVTKSYLLDLDAASGLPRHTAGEATPPEEGVEQIPARSDGKCVIQNGDVQITAERPLFSPDALTIKIDDGAGSVTSYTVDFPDEPAPEQPPTSATEPAPAHQPPPANAVPDQPPAQPPAAQPAANQHQAPAAQQPPVDQPAPAGVAADQHQAPGGQPGVQHPPAAQPAPTDVAADQRQAPSGQPAVQQPPADQPAAVADQHQAPSGQPSAGQSDVAAERHGVSGVQQPAGDQSAAVVADQDRVVGGQQGSAGQLAVEGADAEASSAGGGQVAGGSVADGRVSAGDVAVEESAGAEQAVGVTSPQAWANEQSGSLSGVLVSDQEDGEAGLAGAPDAVAPQPPEQPEAALGMAGAGAPMLGTPGGSGGEAGRAGSGWSVHGDLFDSAEPVHSMHGVLGADDLDT